jgi:hypothetical protein
MTREQAVALAAACLVVALCGFAVIFALQMQSDAAEQLADSRALLARLSRAGAAVAGGAEQNGQAPPAAFIEAATYGHAGAELQAQLSRTALADGAFVMSTGVEAETKGEPDAVRVQATLEATFAAVQALLYHLEAGTPYLAVETLTLQPSGPAVQRSTGEAPFRLTVVLRGIWRRAGS